MALHLFPRICATVILVSWVASAQAATYYVGTPASGASNSNDCTNATNPTDPTKRKHTINAGIGCLSSGDTLVIGDGTYAEVIADYNGIGGYSVAPPAGTSWSNLTTIRAENTRQVILDTGPGSSPIDGGTMMNFENGRQFIVIDGLVLYRWGVGLGGPGGAQNLRFSNMTIHYPIGMGFIGDAVNTEFLNVNINSAAFAFETDTDVCTACGGPPGTCGGTCHGYYMHGSNLLVDGGTIDRSNGYGLQWYAYNSTIRNMTMTRHNASVLLIGGGNLVYNNLIYNNKAGIHIPSDNNTLVGNTLYSNDEIIDGGNNGGIFSTGSNNTIKNNLVVQSVVTSERAYIYQAGGSAPSYNALCESVPSTVAGNMCDNSTMCGCTLAASGATYFMNPGGLDFRLHASSPAIGAGVTLASPYNVDRAGVTRVAPYDVGAYQSTGATASPVPTSLAFAASAFDPVAAGDLFMVTVRVLDEMGALYSATSVPVSLSLVAPPGGALLAGVFPQPSSGGLALFSDLSVTPAGTYTLRATAPDLASADSPLLTVSPAGEIPPAPTEVTISLFSTGHLLAR